MRGFKAYLGMMRLDLTQNHPVLRTFVDLMNEEKSKQIAEDGNEFAEVQIVDGFVQGNFCFLKNMHTYLI